MPVTLNWSDNSVAESGQRVYRSTSPMTPGSLPEPIATLGPNVESYSDTTVLAGVTYYYRISAYVGDAEVISDEISVYTNPSDPYWLNVVALLHFDTSINDETGRSWAASGSPQLNGSQFKFGAGSLNPNGGYLSAAANSAFGFGTGDFTVECWIYPTTTGSLKGIVDTADNVANWTGFQLLYNNGKIQAATNSNGTTGSRMESTSSIPVNNRFYHVAAARSGSTLRLFIDGNLEGTISDSMDLGSSRTCLIGADRTFTNKYSGLIDEVRITKGVARYTASFTPPDRAFPAY